MGQRNDDDDLTSQQNARLKRAWRRVWMTPLIMVPVMFVVITLNDRFNPPAPTPWPSPVAGVDAVGGADGAHSGLAG